MDLNYIGVAFSISLPRTYKQVTRKVRTNPLESEKSAQMESYEAGTQSSHLIYSSAISRNRLRSRCASKPGSWTAGRVDPKRCRFVREIVWPRAICAGGAGKITCNVYVSYQKKNQQLGSLLLSAVIAQFPSGLNQTLRYPLLFSLRHLSSILLRAQLGRIPHHLVAINRDLGVVSAGSQSNHFL